MLMEVSEVQIHWYLNVLKDKMTAEKKEQELYISK